jgi:hypothetical protein
MSHPCWEIPMPSGSHVSRLRTYEATTSAGSRISRTFRNPTVQLRSMSREAVLRQSPKPIASPEAPALTERGCATTR